MFVEDILNIHLQVNLNEYAVTLEVYSECPVPLAANQFIFLTNSCGFNDTVIQLTGQNSLEISQVCPSSLPMTQCNSGNITGIAKHTYSGTYTLPGVCSEWTFSWINTNRTPGINVTNGSIYFETKLNNLMFPNNSSPIIDGIYEVPYLCTSQPIDYSLFTHDLNSDSLSFSLTTALSATSSSPFPFYLRNTVYSY